METLKKYFNKNYLALFTSLIVILHPIIGLDYLLYPILNTFGLPRLTTIVNLIILPLLVVLTFYLFEKNKKKVLIFLLVYGVIFGIYFVLHCMNANYLQNNLYLTRNFVFLLSDEIVYTFTLLLPLAYVWTFYKQEINESLMKTITIGISSLVSIPIFISNLFVFGKSTYDGYTIQNFLSWFSLPFNNTTNHPRYYATKFFFEEGNTIGILLFLVLPFLYYYFFKEKNTKKKIAIFVLIVIHSLSMIILSTRVGTYGAILIPVAMLCIYVVLLLFKIEKFNKVFVSSLVIMVVLTSVIYPFSPAYQNQQIDAQDYVFQKASDDDRDEGTQILREGEEGLVKYSEEWFGFYTFMFEAYSYMIRVTPPVYYLDFYLYKHDPEFWVDLIFDYQLEERVNGRQIQSIFLHYKWDPLPIGNKMFGLGYGTFMRGSMILERDFAQQYYSYGPIGFSLIMAPWFLIAGYLGIKLIMGYKKGKWTYFNIILMMSLCLGLVSSYVSGHTMDELSSSLFIALCAGALFFNLRRENEQQD